MEVRESGEDKSVKVMCMRRVKVRVKMISLISVNDLLIKSFVIEYEIEYCGKQ